MNGVLRYRHRFEVHAPISEVVEFHRRSASMASITPPPLRVDAQRAPERLSDGDEMAFTLGVGPLRIPWLAQITEVTPTGFVDRQLEGPFQHWVHRHSFEPVEDGGTIVIDEVEAGLSRNSLWWAVGLAMWLGLPLLFAFRGWKTRKLLEAAKRGVLC
jgi:ligand-binding SRPBCC domain-containing protein